MFNRFDTLLQSKSKESIELLNHIEGLFFALNRAELLWDDNNPNIKMKISFQSCLTFDSNSSKTYIDLL
jgi:hypothetical protein